MAAKRGHLERLTYESLKCLTTIAFGTFYDVAEGELIRDLLLPTSLPNCRKRVGGQLKTWASTIKDDLAALSGPQVVGLRWWNRDWLAISCNLAQDPRTWAAMVWDTVLAREKAGSTRSERKPIQVQVSILSNQEAWSNSPRIPLTVQVFRSFWSKLFSYVWFILCSPLSQKFASSYPSHHLPPQKKQDHEIHRLISGFSKRKTSTPFSDGWYLRATLVTY